MEEQRKEVTILAKGDSRIECPFVGEVWGLNDVMELPEFANKKVDLLFTFDPRSDEYIAAMRKHAPVVSWRTTTEEGNKFADIMYPLDEIEKRYSPKYKYWTNTVGYMIAYALYKGYKKISMYGVDAPFGGIYFLEKPGIEYWCGKCEEAGVEIETTEGSHILRTKDGLRYGERGDGWLRLYIFERLCLLNILPRKGNKDTIHIINMARNLLSLKDDEAKKYNIGLTQKMDGSVNYNVTKEGREFSRPIWMPRWAWQYLADLLIDAEQRGELSALAESVYQKLVSYGNADKFPAKPAPGQIKVSYIMPTKNRAAWVKNTLENIQRSNLLNKHTELIVVDGNSTDETASVLREFSPMITQVIRGKDNNASEASNKGFLAARGEYVKIYPDDDVIFPEGMTKAIEYMDAHPEIDLLVCGGTKKQGDKMFPIRAPENYGHEYADVFRYGACGVGFLHRRLSFSKTGLYNLECLVVDQEFALRTITNGTVRFFPGQLYLHAIYPHSISVRDAEKIAVYHKELVRRYCPELLLNKSAEMVK